MRSGLTGARDAGAESSSPIRLSISSPRKFSGPRRHLMKCSSRNGFSRPPTDCLYPHLPKSLPAPGMADSPVRSLSRSALIGTSWLLAQNVGTRAISFAAQIILAKLLAPADFGTIGLALTVTTFASVVANFGVDDVLLQRQKSLRFWA